MRIRRVSFGFHHAQLCFSKVETGIFPLEFGAQTIGKQRPFSGAQGGKVDPCAPQPWFDAANTLSEQQSLDAVDMGGALPHQPLAFTMRTACVFFLDGWNANDGANMPVAAVDGHERSHEHPRRARRLT